jgi:mono/diheme cytochrome c family protein
MGTHNRLMAVLFISLIAIAADIANAKKPADRADADAGHDLALDACTGCHVVSGAPSRSFGVAVRPPFRCQCR